MNKLRGNNALSFERVLFLSIAVFAIVIMLPALEIKVPRLEAERVSKAGLSVVAIAFAGFVFPLVPVVANLLSRKKKGTTA